jgi:hypothetical protein
MTWIRVLLALLLVVTPVFAQTGAQPKAVFVTAYELDATDPTYCVTTGKDGNPWNGAREGKGTGGSNIKTSGSSTTVTEVATDSLPFTLLSVGDQIFVNGNVRYITAKASGASITVNAAVNIENSGAGYPFQWNKRSCGTTAADGWMSVAGTTEITVKIQVDQVVVTGGVNVTIQCRDNTHDTVPFTIYPDPNDTSTEECHTLNFTAVAACAYIVPGSWDSCRVGVEIGTADDGDDLTTNAEDITATIHVRR